MAYSTHNRSFRRRAFPGNKIKKPARLPQLRSLGATGKSTSLQEINTITTGIYDFNGNLQSKSNRPDLVQSTIAQIPLGSSRLDTTRHVQRVEPMHFGCVEPVKQHSLTRSTRRARLARHDELDRCDLQLSYDHHNSFIVYSEL